MGQKQKSIGESGKGPTLERVEAERDVWCLLVRDAVTGEIQQAFLDYCSHKSIPLGPKAGLTKKGQICCPHHNVCFDCASGAVIDDKGKKTPLGLVPVALERATKLAEETASNDINDDTPVLIITPEHRTYLSKHLQKLDKSRKSSTKTRRKEQNHAGDLNKTND